MKIIFLAHRVPFPPDRGDRIRSYNILRYLSERHEVHLACTSDEHCTTHSVKQLTDLCPQVFIAPPARKRRWLGAAASFLCGQSATQGLFHSRKLGRALDRFVAQHNYDAAFIFCSSMAPYLSRPSLRQLPALIDLVDVDSLKWSQYSAAARGANKYLYATEAERVATLERMCGARASALTVVSEKEATALLAHYPDANCHVIPNGVDLTYFSYQPQNTQEAAPRCAFVGALDYPPNIDAVVWFGREIWPSIQRRFPTAIFQVIGRNPNAAVKALRNQVGIDVVGEVADVRPYLSSASVVVAPLRLGRGIQNKVLEAMACGRAVVASPTALSGLQAVDASHVRRADTIEEWTESVLTLLADPGLRSRMAHAARSYVEDRHDWSECLRPLDELLRNAVSASSGARSSEFRTVKVGG